MALIKSIKGLTPKWGKECYFSENATIVGEVTMGDECSVWFNAVVRGDVAYIKIGDRTNVQILVDILLQKRYSQILHELFCIFAAKV